MMPDANAVSLRERLPLPLMAAIAALPALGIDMYLPAMPQIAADLMTEISTVQNSLSVFLIGFAIGLLVFGPFSDRHGRRPLALFGLTGFATASLLLAFNDNAVMFLFCRVLQGFLGSAATVTVPAMIRDCYGKDTAKGMSSVLMIMLVAPLIAPLLGSLVLSVTAWNGIFGFLTLYPLILLLTCFFRLPETKPAAVAGERRTMLGNYRVILGNPKIYPDLLTLMMSALAFFTYVTSVSFIYITWYGASETLFGLLFAASASSLILANFINMRLVTRFGPRRMMLAGVGLATIFALLLLLALQNEMALGWIVTSFVCLMGCLALISVNGDSLLLIEFPQQASSAAAVLGTLRFGSGALAGPILAWRDNGTPLPVAQLLLIALGLACVLQTTRILINRSTARL